MKLYRDRRGTKWVIPGIVCHWATRIIIMEWITIARGFCRTFMEWWKNYFLGAPQPLLGIWHIDHRVTLLLSLCGRRARSQPAMAHARGWISLHYSIRMQEHRNHNRPSLSILNSALRTRRGGGEYCSHSLSPPPERCSASKIKSFIELLRLFIP